QKKVRHQPSNDGFECFAIEVLVHNLSFSCAPAIRFRSYFHPNVSVGDTRCAVPECRGISHADATFREALWDRFFTAAPRPRMPSELLYTDRRLRSKGSPAATILIRKR